MAPPWKRGGAFYIVGGAGMSDGGDLKRELYTLWQAQEGLLQHYRGYTMVLQALLGAGSVALMSIIGEQLADTRRAVHGIGATQFDVPDLVLLTEYLLLLVFLVLGWSNLVAMRRIANNRARLVSFFQQLIMRHESGVLFEELKNAKFIENVGDMVPFLRMLKAVEDVVPRRPGPFTTEQFDYLWSLKTSSAGTPLVHGFTRTYLTKDFFDIFALFWTVTLYIALLFLLALMIPG
jgi:hypothetical protein